MCIHNTIHSKLYRLGRAGGGTQAASPAGVNRGNILWAASTTTTTSHGMIPALVPPLSKIWNTAH